MTQIVKVLMELILSVVIILLIINFMFPGRLVDLLTGGTTSSMPVVKFLGKPAIDLITNEDDSARRYEYDITFTGNVEYSGKIEDPLAPLPSIKVIPVIDFKDSSSKAFVDGKEEPFTIKPEERTFNGEFKATVSSRIPPMRPKPNPYTGIMKKGDTFLLKSLENGQEYNLTVTLKGLRKLEVGWWFVDIFKTSCEASFDVKCGEIASFKLKQLDECGEKDKLDCERYLSMCKGTVHVRVDRTYCNKNEAKVFIEFAGGMDYGVWEEAGISFWRYSEIPGRCRDAPNYDSLWSECGESYFLGRYTFNIIKEIE